MMRYFTILILITCFLKLSGQGRVLSTSYIYNKLAINPGYAGHTEVVEFTAFNRSQWIGIKGSPQSNTITANFGKRSDASGFGVNLQRLSFGITSVTDFSLSYGYKIAFGDWKLTMGVSPNVGNGAQNFISKDLVAVDGIPNDDAIPKDLINEVYFNVGAGLYLSSDNKFLGASTNSVINSVRILDNNLTIPLTKVFALMGGIKNTLNDEVNFLAQAMFRVGQNNFQAFDASIMADFRSQLYFGGGIRIGKPFSNAGLLNLGVGLKNGFIGLAYDFPLSAVRLTQGGSFEFIGSYTFVKEEKRKYEGINPRFF
jgi:type IX secretion system PorP/SprF family membrane protein